MNNELQKDDFILPGGLGTVTIGNSVGDITQVFKGRDNVNTITVKPRCSIKKRDIVLHELSGLYFRCENSKMERWMNMNPYYVKSELPKGYLL